MQSRDVKIEGDMLYGLLEGETVWSIKMRPVTRPGYLHKTNTISPYRNLYEKDSWDWINLGVFPLTCKRY